MSKYVAIIVIILITTLFIGFRFGDQLMYKPVDNSLYQSSRISGKIFFHDPGLKIIHCELPEANIRSSFEIITRGIAKNDKYVYLGCEIINGADPASFEIIEREFFRDKKQVYYRTIVIPEANPATFAVLHDTDYAKDDKNIFFKTKKLTEVDYNSFELFVTDRNTYHPLFAKDKNTIYYAEKKLIGGDHDSFEILSSIDTAIDAQDKNIMYNFEWDNKTKEYIIRRSERNR